MWRASATKLIVLLILVGLISGCGIGRRWFGKKPKDRPPDELAQEGIEALRNRNYYAAEDHFAKIKDRYPYSEQALMAQIKLADSLYYNEKFDEAQLAYQEFEKLHPTNKAIPYVIYQQALCYYRQRPTIDRDQTFTQKALAEFRRLQKKFPQSEYASKAEKYKLTTVADGEAEAVTKVYGAIHQGNPTGDLIAIKYLEALRAVADGKATKIFLPLETSGILGSLAGIGEIFKDIKSPEGAGPVEPA